MHLNDTPSLTPFLDYSSLTTMPVANFGSDTASPAATSDAIPMNDTPTASYTPPLSLPAPATQTLPVINVPFTPTPAAPPAAPQAPDWFTRNVVPLVQAGLTTWAAVNQYNTAAATAAARLPAGVSPSALPIAGKPQLTQAQLATMTPQQVQTYYGISPQPSLTSALGLSGMSPTTMLLLGGGTLLTIALLIRKK